MEDGDKFVVVNCIGCGQPFSRRDKVPYSQRTNCTDECVQELASGDGMKNIELKKTPQSESDELKNER